MYSVSSRATFWSSGTSGVVGVVGVFGNVGLALLGGTRGGRMFLDDWENKGNVCDVARTWW